MLVVDDDESVRLVLELALRAEGWSVRQAASTDEALQQVQQVRPDLVVVDVALGSEDGRQLLSHLRREWSIPVVLISGFGGSEDRVIGLRLGADDFLSKPFSPLELVARVEAVLRRSRAGRPNGDEAGLRIEAGAREVFIDGRRVQLTAREFDLLSFLASRPRQVFTRGQLLDRVWHSQSGWQDEATVTEHVRRLRQKLEQDPAHPRWLVTVRGVGYRFEP